MQSFIWAPEHSDALRDCLSRGMSYGQAANAINTRFGTEFTRNAAVGRAKRLGLAVVAARKVRRPAPKARPVPVRQAMPQPARSGDQAPPAPKPVKPVKLRCVGIKPRLLAFADLAPGDCRYPYGGEKEGEVYAFCGHPKVAGSSYCRPHLELTRGVGTAFERMAVAVTLRLIQAA